MTSLEAYREAMWSTVRAPLPPPIPINAPRVFTVTYYGTREWLRRRGFITEGELVFHRLDPKPPTVVEIQRSVAEHFGIGAIEMTSERRAHDVAHPRQVAMYLCKQLTPRSLPDIGRRFGGRDHTTVIHAVRQVEKRCKEDPQLAHAVTSLAASLNAKACPIDRGAPWNRVPP